MDSKEKNLQDIIDCGVVAIVRVGSAQEAIEVCGAIAKGGVKPIEVTMTVPGAIDAIKEFKSAMKGKVIVAIYDFENGVWIDCSEIEDIKAIRDEDSNLN